MCNKDGLRFGDLPGQSEKDSSATDEQTAMKENDL